MALRQRTRLFIAAGRWSCMVVAVFGDIMPSVNALINIVNSTCCGNGEELDADDEVATTVKKINVALGEALVSRCPKCQRKATLKGPLCKVQCPYCETEFNWFCGREWSLCYNGIDSPNDAKLTSLTALQKLLASRDMQVDDRSAADMMVAVKMLVNLSRVKKQVGRKTWKAVRRRNPGVVGNIVRRSGLETAEVWEQVDNASEWAEKLPDSFG